jgi:hypothetical protein
MIDEATNDRSEGGLGDASARPAELIERESPRAGPTAERSRAA